ncbi:unnamed protein product [Larinioides sclopetarius]|uniref:Uncharacterized protein n=1 Tax=Larinioides sclopetarius TaxID=280406 RepID=A0AAV1YUT7_9ARAC
MFFRKKHTK